MKKYYSKPRLIYDSFELSESVAAGCEIIANHAENDSCSYYDEDFELNIYNTIGTCDYVTGKDDGDKFNGICYHVPMATNNVFTS